MAANEDERLGGSDGTDLRGATASIKCQSAASSQAQSKGPRAEKTMRRQRRAYEKRQQLERDR